MQRGSMSRKLTSRDLRKLERDEHGATSAVYRYIRENYTELTSRGVGTGGGPSWESVAQLLTCRGQTNGRGGPLTGEVVRKLFARVSKEIRAKTARAEPFVQGLRPPARQSPNWQPPIRHSHAPPSPPANPSPAINQVPSQVGDEHLPTEVRAKLAAVESQFAYLDRHIVRPKQKG
jgi:hypothetical protein